MHAAMFSLFPEMSNTEKTCGSFIRGLFKQVHLWNKVCSLYMDMPRIVRVEQLLAEFTGIVAGEVLVFDVVDHVMFLHTSLGALQTLKEVDI